jgi:hypothetical protein
MKNEGCFLLYKNIYGVSEKHEAVFFRFEIFTE